MFEGNMENSEKRPQPYRKGFYRVTRRPTNLNPSSGSFIVICHDRAQYTRVKYLVAHVTYLSGRKLIYRVNNRYKY